MAGNTNVTLSSREMEVLALAWQCMETQPKINMEKLAGLTGYTVGSAGVTFGNIKRKIKLLGESLSANGPTTPKKNGGPGRGGKTPSSTPSKRGAASSTATPSKRACKTTAPRQPTSSPVEELSPDEDDDDDFDHDGPKVKKEEPAFDQPSDFLVDDLPNRGTRALSYGFLDGIETFGAAAGTGRNASTGYRASFAQNAE